MRRRLRVKLPKNGCVKEGNACLFLDASARTELERWNHEKNENPKMESRRGGVFGAGALSKDGFRQQVTQWASASLPVPVSFLFGRHADSCRQLRIFTNWGDPLSATGFCADFLTSFWGSLE